ncbi:MAG: hypothetical protein WKF66_08780 [Pedobacter sp.]
MIKSLVRTGILPLMIVLAFASCKKMKPGKPTPVTETEEVEKPAVVIPPKKKNMLPVKITTSDLTVDLVYMENTALITEMKFSGGIVYLMTYADNVLKKLQKYKDKVNSQSVDYLIANGQITRASRFDISGQRSTPTEKYYLTYNTSSQINNIKTYAVSGSLLTDNTLGYQANGNLLSSAVTASGSVSDYNYSYDIKNNIFQSVLFCQLLRIEINEVFLNPGINNILSFTNPKLLTEHVAYEYLYGTDDYPTEVRIKHSGISKTYKITYTELK